MKLFGFDIKKARSRSPGISFSDWLAGMEHISSDNHAALIKAYRSWVYVCANKNSNTLAQQSLRLYAAKQKGQKTIARTRTVDKDQLNYLSGLNNISALKSVKMSNEIEEVLEHPFLDLMNRVNPFMNSFEMWDLTGLYQELIGNCYWYIVSDNAFGIPDVIWILPGENMQIIPDKQNFIKGYVYKQGTQEIPFEPDEIVHFKYSNPQDMYYGKSPLSAVTQAYNINENIGMFDNALFSNMARPEGALHTENSLNDAEFERLKQEWKSSYGGVSKAGKVAILEKGLKYEPFTMSPKELNHIEGRNAVKEEICNAYGQSIALYDKSANRANSEQANKAFLRDTIQPRLRRIEQKINERIMPLYDQNIFVAYDNPVPEDKAHRLKERESNLKTGYSSINQERLRDNQEPVEWGEKPILPQGMIPLGSMPDEGSKFVVRQVMEKIRNAGK